MIRRIILSGLFLVTTAGWAMAQPTNDIDGLRAALAQRPEEATVDTALVFTNVGGQAAKVRVQAFLKNGDPAGSADFDVPAKGLVYILASDLRPASVEALLGHAEAISRDRSVIATAVLLGAGTTDLPVKVRPGVSPNATMSPTAVPPVRYVKHIFPVIAAY